MELSMFDIIEKVDKAPTGGYTRYGEGVSGRASLNGDEVKAVHDRLHQIAENEDVFACLWDAKDHILDMVSQVKAQNANSPFVGAGAEGNQLDMRMLIPSDVDKTGTAQTTWVFSASEGTDYYESAASDGDCTTGEDEGRVYCGWVDPIDEPKMVNVQYSKDGGLTQMLVDTPFDMVKDYPIVRHKPFKVFTEQDYNVQVRYDAGGDDKAIPVAVVIRRKKNLGL